MTLCTDIQGLLESGNQLLFEVHYNHSGETEMSISTRAKGKGVISTLTTEDVTVSVEFDTLEEALSYWIFNLEKESGHTMYSSVVREMRRLIFDWI